MKLTKQIKEAILEAALKKAGIPEKQTAILARYAAWAEALRTEFVTPEVVDKINAAKELLKGMHPTLNARATINHDPYIRANVGGQWRRIYWCGSQTFGSAKDDNNNIITPHEPIIPADSKFTQQLYEIDHDAAALDSETEQLKLSLMAVLNSVNTDKRLIEVWPEAVAFIPAAEKANTPQLPALPIAELNKLIGLP